MPEIAVSQPELPLVPVAPAARPARFEMPAEEDPVKETPAVVSEPVKNTEDAAPSSPSEEKPEPEVTPELAAKRSERRAQNRLEKAFRQRAEAQAKADLLEKQLAEFKQAQQPKAPEGEPRLEQFDFDPEKYAAAKAEYAKTQATKEFETKQRTEAQQNAQRKLVAEWETKAERGSDKYDDWQDKVGDIKPSAPFVAAFMEAENGDDIAYYLGTHPKEAQRIAELPPLSQVREIGKLEAKLLSEPAKPKTLSKAPAPITPLSGAATVASDAPSEQDDYADWFRKRNKQVHGRR